jgi:general secretion pathway protein D
LPDDVVVNAVSGTITVNATDKQHQLVQQHIDSIVNAMQRQVLIEATIAEVVLTDQLRYGVQYFLESGSFAAGFVSALQDTLAPQPITPGFNFLFTPGGSNITIDALSQLADVRVLSAPSVVVQDNSEAVLTVGEEVPVQTQQQQSLDADSNILNSIEYRDTGVILLVTPRVNQSGLVIMEIQQEISNVVDAPTTTVSEESSPTINQRQINSTVAILSGETVALGGLIQDQRERAQSGIPFLSRLPIVGALFRSRSNNVTRTELLVLITPSVVENPARARAVTDELRRRLRSLEQLESRVR